MVTVAGMNPTRPPANIEDFLWNMHMVLSAQPEPVQLDQVREVYSKQLGHKCSIERFLVVNPESGLAATLKRIPHIVTVVVEGGQTLVKATLTSDCTKDKLIEEDKKYRDNLMKKNAAAKAKSAAAKAAGAASPEPKAGEKRPADGAVGGDAKKARGDSSDAETLARMLVQGVVRVLQHRLKEGKGSLPLADLEEEFKALWKVPFNLQQAGEKDPVTFFQKWPNKVEVVTEGGVHMVQLCKRGDGKAKAAVPAAAGASAPPAVPAKAAAPPVAKKAASVAATVAAPAEVAKVASQAVAKSVVARPTRPPSCIEDFLWNIHIVLEAHGSPLPLDQLKDVYSKHLGHKCVVERFLVVGEGGLPATLKRIPHIVTVVQEGSNFFVKPTLPAGITKEVLVAEDVSYRKALQDKATAAPPTAAVAKRPAEAGAPVDIDVKKSKGEDAETLARMLVQGVVRVLQNRQKEGKGPLPLASLEDEFKALWKVPFNLQQAGENDAVSFLSKWPNKVELTGDGTSMMVSLAKKGGDKAKAAGAKAGGAVAAAGVVAAAKAAAVTPAVTSPDINSPPASPMTSPLPGKDAKEAAPAAAQLSVAAAAVVAAAASAPPAVREHAESLMEAVKAMTKDMERHHKALAQRVEALANALRQASPA